MLSTGTDHGNCQREYVPKLLSIGPALLGGEGWGLTINCRAVTDIVKKISSGEGGIVLPYYLPLHLPMGVNFLTQFIFEDKSPRPTPNQLSLWSRVQQLNS